MRHQCISGFRRTFEFGSEPAHGPELENIEFVHFDVTPTDSR